VLAVVIERDLPVSEVCRLFEPLPQVLRNVHFNGGLPLEMPSVKAAIDEGEARLAGNGRVLIRPSGTEPVIRVMAEGDDHAVVDSVVGDIVEAIEHVAQGR
ncbi:MAG: hypothetical protein VW835_17120, partial [Rickettsiales bacterium]